MFCFIIDIDLPSLSQLVIGQNNNNNNNNNNGGFGFGFGGNRMDGCFKELSSFTISSMIIQRLIIIISS